MKNVIIAGVMVVVCFFGVSCYAADLSVNDLIVVHDTRCTAEIVKTGLSVATDGWLLPDMAIFEDAYSSIYKKVDERNIYKFKSDGSNAPFLTTAENVYVRGFYIETGYAHIMYLRVLYTDGLSQSAIALIKIRIPVSYEMTGEYFISQPLHKWDTDGDGDSDSFMRLNGISIISYHYIDGEQRTAYSRISDVLPDTNIVQVDIDGDGKDEGIINFGSRHGIWIYHYGEPWVQLHNISPRFMVSADLDGNNKADLVIDFGPQYGVWIYYNNNEWKQLHTISPESIGISDMDNNGIDDIVCDFGSQYGVWIYYNNLTWSQQG